MLSGRYLVSSGEALGLTPSRTVLHVDDLAVGDRQNLVTLASTAVLVLPDRGTDDPVVAHEGELGFTYRQPTSSLVDREPQDLTGLVRPTSARRVSPQEEATRGAAPFGVVCKQGGKRVRIAPVQSLGRFTQLIDHDALDYDSRGTVVRICRVRSSSSCTSRDVPTMWRHARWSRVWRLRLALLRTCG